MGDTKPTPTLPSLTNSFGSFLFPDRGNIVKVSDPKIPSVEDPFKDLFKPESSLDPTLSVSQGLEEDRVVFSDNNNNNNNNNSDTELEISNVTMMAGEEVTTENIMSDNLDLDIKNIGEVIDTNDLPTEIIEEEVTDSSVNTRESRLLESPTGKTFSKSDGEIHFEKIYRGTGNIFTYSILLNIIVLYVILIM